MIEKKIISTVIEAVNQLYSKDVEENKIQLQKTRKEFDGDITLVVFSMGCINGKKPEIGANLNGVYHHKNL